MGQPVLPLLPADARPVGPSAGLVEGPEGGVVFVFGLASFTFGAGDEPGRRLAAVQLVATGIATSVEVAAAFAVSTVTLRRWCVLFERGGVGALMRERPGPRGPSKLTDALRARIVGWEADGLTLAQIAERAGVSTATVRVALGRVAGRRRTLREQEPYVSASPGAVEESPRSPDSERLADAPGLTALARPVPRTAERQEARCGQLVEAPVVITEGTGLPLAGLLLALPALEGTGLLGAAGAVFGPLRKGFYGLRATLLMLVFLALVREPRAEGATRVATADLGRVLGLDRGPEVKTLRRKLSELASAGQGAALQAELAGRHAATRPGALGFLHVDGHVRVYTGSKQVPKAHITRMRIAGPATEETWVADADGDPVMVLVAPPSASLAAELRRLLPDLRAVVGQRRCTVVFDRGGYSPAVFAEITAAGFDLLTYYKGTWARSPQTAFTRAVFTDPDGQVHGYELAERSITLPAPAADPVTLRLIVRRSPDGHQTPILTSRTDLSAAQIAWRMSRRWRQENYFKYAREHFALDALDSYADTPDDPDRPVPNPAKAQALATVSAARAHLTDAHTRLADAIEQAAARAGRPGNGGRATVDPTATDAVQDAEQALDDAVGSSRQTVSHLPLGQVRPGTVLLDTERKLITHAIRMSAYNTETALARLLRPHYARAEREGRALLREAFTLPGDLQINGDTLHVRLEPATAPRRTRAIAALCEQLLNETETRYPGTDLTLHYTIKTAPTPT